MHMLDVLDKDVYDVNGHRLGHVDLAREADGFLLFDVHLDGAGRRLVGTRDDVVTLAEEDVVATDNEVTLAEDAERLLRVATAASFEA